MLKDEVMLIRMSINTSLSTVCLWIVGFTKDGIADVKAYYTAN